MIKPVAVLGGGGHARVVIDLLKAMSLPILGAIDPRSDLVLPQGIRHLGTDLQCVSPTDCVLAIGVGSIDVGARNPRPRIFNEAKAAGFELATLRHPSAVVAGDTQINEGSQVMAGAVIQTGTVIGRNVIVNTSVSIDHDCVIGDHVHLAPGVILSGGVRVDPEVHLGTGAIVIQGIVIAARAMVGAGAVVTQPVAADTRVRPKR